MMTLTRSPDGQAGVDHRIGLVHPAVDGGDDALDGLHQLLVGGEAQRELLDPAAALDEDLVRAVDHDLGDGGVLEERFEDAEAEGLVDDPADQLGAFGGGEDRALAADDVAEDALQAGPALGGGERGHLGEVDLLEQLGAVDGDEVAVLAAARSVLLGGGDAGPQAHGLDSSSVRRVGRVVRGRSVGQCVGRHGGGRVVAWHGRSRDGRGRPSGMTTGR